MGAQMPTGQVPNLSADAFAAADAANLASQGLNQSQMYSALNQAGAPNAAFMAADASQLAGQGLGQAAIEQNMNPAANPASQQGFDWERMSKALGTGMKEIKQQQAEKAKEQLPQLQLLQNAQAVQQGQQPNFQMPMQSSGAMQAIGSQFAQQGQQQPQSLGQMMQNMAMPRR